ncbi:MAG: hypothetical protein LBN71_10585 [Tannerella sp.]|nr:hypothetical protein [Tannerella sp.]
MKTKIMYVLFSLLCCLSCTEKEDMAALQGTKWKLAGFVDAQTGELTVAEPQDCEECYTLAFDTDHTAVAHSIIMDVNLDLLDLAFDKPYQKMYIDEGHRHGSDFRLAIFTTGLFSVTPDELKLFYNYKKNYLLFKLIEQ